MDFGRKNFFLDFRFDRVGKFHAARGNQLDAIIVIRIVRRGNHHAGGESFIANEPGHARSCEHARGNRLRACRREASGETFFDVRAGFARVAADQHRFARLSRSGRLRTMQIMAERSAYAD